MRDEFGRELIPCGLCGKPTPMLGTKRCDQCWELESRILNDKALTFKILKLHNLEVSDGNNSEEHC